MMYDRLAAGMMSRGKGADDEGKMRRAILEVVDEGIARKEEETKVTYAYLTRDLLAKIEIGCKMGYDAKQLALFCGIRIGKLEKLMEKYPLLRENMALWGGEVVGLAKKNIYDAVRKGDLPTSQWVLERLAKGEYGRSSSVEITHTGSSKRVSMQEIIEARERIGITSGEEEDAQYEGIEDGGTGDTKNN